MRNSKRYFIRIISSVTVIVFLVTTTSYAEPIFRLRVPVGERDGSERILDLIKVYSDAEQMRFISSNDIQIPRTSLKRAWMHRFELWKKERVFEIPLITSDHFILIVLPALASILIITAYIPIFFMDFLGVYRWPIAYLVFIPVLFSEAVYIDYAFSHVKVTQDGLGVFYRTKEYLRDPETAKIDKALLRKIEEFKKSTGWEVVWTDSPYVLAWPRLEYKQVVMTVGWVVSSSRKKDKRRLNYLEGVLDNMSDAIKKRSKALSAKISSKVFRSKPNTKLRQSL